MKIGIIAGGNTAEAAHTLASAQQVSASARSLGHTTTVIELPKQRSDDALGWIADVRRCDIAFPMVSGIEGILSALQRPYIASDPTAAGVGADKGFFNDLLRAWGYGKTPYLRLSEEDDLSRVDAAALNYPLFVKPARLGASIGIERVPNRGALEEAVRVARSHDPLLVIEQGVLGREIEVAAIVGREIRVSRPGVLSLPAGHAWHSPDVKATAFGRLETAHDLDAAIVEELDRSTRDIARRTGVACGVRIDYFLTDDGQILVGEINCLPGHGKLSNFPYLFESSGLDRVEQLRCLIDAALWSFDRAETAQVRF